VSSNKGTFAARQNRTGWGAALPQVRFGQPLTLSLPTPRISRPLAAKYEEKEEACPSADRLVQYVLDENRRDGVEYDGATGMSRQLVCQMEVLLLNKLNWCLTIITPLHYLGLFHRKVRPRDITGESARRAREKASSR
jgi:hypothetical protein